MKDNDVSFVQIEDESQHPRVYTNFSLEKEESCSLVFNEAHMNIEPQDHPDNIFHDYDPPSHISIKQEPHDEPFIRHYRKDPSLLDFLDQIRVLTQKTRFIEELVLTTCKEPIYKYGIGYDSDCEREQEKIYQEEKHEDIFESGDLMDRIIKIEEPESSQFGTRECHNNKIQKSGNPLLITIPPISNSNQREIIWMVEAAVKCQEKSFSFEEKKMLLQTLEKLDSTRRGIIKLISGQAEEDHICKHCGKKFETGRKLGGHISRRHPGNSFEYQMKLKVRKTKACERKRRDYMKDHQEKEDDLT